MGMNNLQNRMVGTPLPLTHGRATPRRTPLSDLNANAGQTSGFAGYGMRAGLKAGNPGALVASEFSRPSVRSGIVISLTSDDHSNFLLVAQRPGSNLPFTRDSGLGTPSISRGGGDYY